MWGEGRKRTGDRLSGRATVSPAGTTPNDDLETWATFVRGRRGLTGGVGPRRNAPVSSYGAGARLHP